MTEEEFDDLYSSLGRPVLRYLLSRTGSAEDAADLLAEVMTVVWTKRATVPPIEDRKPWLYGIARNMLLRHHRRRSQHRLAVDKLTTALLAAPSAYPAMSGVQVDFNRALRRLRPVDAEILSLSVWEGLTAVEIGKVLAMPATTVRVRMKRARDKLRADLGATSDLDWQVTPAPNGLRT